MADLFGKPFSSQEELFKDVNPRTSFEALDTPVTLDSFNAQIGNVHQELLHGEAGLDRSTKEMGMFLRGIAMTGKGDIRDPRTRNPNVSFSPGERVDAVRFNKDRFNKQMSQIMSVEKRMAVLEGWARDNPVLAKQIGLHKTWLDDLKKTAASAGQRGWRIVDTILRNLDRGRGAVAAYSHTMYQGGRETDAIRRAKAAFIGSERGWKWVPEVQGPMFKEVLEAAGVDPGFMRTAGGFTLDVIIDPINLLGIGAAREGIEIGAHQILNRAGRALHGKYLGEAKELALAKAGVRDMTELPVDELDAMWREGNERMAQHIRSLDRNGANELLDIGGLKIAGMTLPGTSFLRKKGALIEGEWKTDWVAESLPYIVGQSTRKGMEKLGRSITLASEGRRGDKLGKLIEALPIRTKNAVLKVGMAFARTNPAAGKDYKMFKQREYLDKLGSDMLRVNETVHRTFGNIHGADLEAMALAIDRGKVEEFLGHVRVVNGEVYYENVRRAVNEYQAHMDVIVIDEVKRGWFQKQWTDEMKDTFERWVKNPLEMEKFLTPQLVERFKKVRYDHYVPIISQNLEKVKVLSSGKQTPRSPSIVEVFTKHRDTPNLDAAIELGYAPLLNLKEIMTVRMLSHSRASVTSDFLEGAAARYTSRIPEAVGSSKLIKDLYTPQARTAWGDVIKMRTANGRIAREAREQLDLARRMAFEPDVPLEAVRRLDDAAREEFIMFRMRHVSSLKGAKRVWKRFVEEPTRKGIYDGFAHAPDKNVHRAYAIAKDFADVNYAQWKMMEVGGLADPDILGKVMLPTPIVDDLARLQKYKILPEEFGPILSLYDRINFWWKRGVTILWPAFHVRNKITNVVNSAMDIGIAGVLDRKTMWTIMRGGDGILVAKNGNRYSYSQIRQLMRKHGVINIEYRRIDVPTQMMTQIMKREGKWSRRVGKQFSYKLPGREALLRRGEALGPAQVSMVNPMQAGEEAGILIENSDRAQLFIKSLQRGMSAEQSAARVNKFLFDYADLGRVDQQIIKRFFNPFWTWTRKNLALQAKLVANRPGRWVSPAKFARAMSVEVDGEIKSDIEREYLPKYFSDYFAIRLDVAQGISKWLMNVDLPAADLDRIWQGSYRETVMDWVGMIGPQAKTLLEYVASKDLYLDRERKQFISGTKMYPIMASLPESIKRTLKMRERTVRGERRIEVDAGRWRAFNYLTLYLASRLYSTVGRITDPNAGTISERMVNLFTGMRTEHIDHEAEMRRVLNRILGDKDVGLKANLDKMYQDYIDELAIESVDRRAAEKEMIQFRDAVTTPEIGAELDDIPDAAWTREEGL